MKYLGKDPFSSKPATDAYRTGWDRVFGRGPATGSRERSCSSCRKVGDVEDGHLAPHGWKFVGDNDWICEDCQ